MTNKLIYRGVALFFLAVVLWAQSDRGTITGTVSDPAGAVVANATVQARHVETGGLYEAASTSTGNYTLAQLPVGAYELSVSVAGFKKYVRQGLVVQTAQTYRIDIGLEVGAANESVTVTEQAPMLKTESGELSTNVATAQLNALPVVGIGASAGSAGIRNSFAVTQLVAGTLWLPNNTIRVSGSPANTQTLRVEGQDSSTGLLSNVASYMQPSVDAIQETAIQTSNFAAEFGQVGGGFFNVTMKSGTNAFHGTAYDYFVNEFLNAGTPFTSTAKGLARPVSRRNDWGFTLGGPLVIPHLYDGHNKTFFFVNYERYTESQTINNLPQTVPTAAYRAGNFTSALTGRSVTVAALGQTFAEGAIFDPLTSRVENGRTIRDLFPGNIVPTNRLDPVALKVQDLIPQPNRTGLINNYVPVFVTPRTSAIPGVKIDHMIGRGKLSGYWSKSGSDAPNAVGGAGGDGLGAPISGGRGSFQNGHTIRINYDNPLTPTLLLHVGVGMLHFYYNDQTEETNFDTLARLGLKGTNGLGRFPRFAGLLQAGTGGMVGMGPILQSTHFEERPTGNVSVTWVKGNHTYKFGGELMFSGYPSLVFGPAVGRFNFTGSSTSQPSTIGQNLGGITLGFPYASFLLGAVDNGQIGVPTDTRLGKHSFAGYVQDTWKVTRKFTLDIGLRYDYQTYFREQYGRAAGFSPTLPNPSAGNLPGATIFEGDGPGHCGCNFAKNYPWGFGPRVGAAYQITEKTVFRAGFGVVYGKPSPNNFASQAFSSTESWTSPGLYAPSSYLKDGVPITPVWPRFDAGLFPQLPGQLTSPLFPVDRNAGRPPRQIQWSIGFQRQIIRNLVAEANYVGNRGAWWQGNSLINVNALSPQLLAARGLSLSNPADLTLLSSAVSSATAQQRGFGTAPYAGFPVASTVAQALRPFPMFVDIPYRWAPLGRTWYDSLQLKVTKRYSQGLDMSYQFIYQKDLTMGAETEDPAAASLAASVNDVFNRRNNKYISGFSQPWQHILVMNYTLPKLAINRIAAAVIRDWQMGTVLRYSAGQPIRVPTSTTSLNTYTFQTTFVNRVPGVPLFLQDLNCHCFDPNKELTLNPAAWQNPALGQFGNAAAYYNDYRYQRRPAESISLARIFRLPFVNEGANLMIRAEFSNIFNRTQMNNPVATNAFATRTVNATTGALSGGFGWINTGTVASNPRAGTLVARFTF
jgi:hypothetical protein